MSQKLNELSFRSGYFAVPVTLSLSPTRHPKIPARSPTMAVKSPIMPREQKKQSQPPAIPAGGIKAKMILGRKENFT